MSLYIDSRSGASDGDTNNRHSDDYYDARRRDTIYILIDEPSSSLWKISNSLCDCCLHNNHLRVCKFHTHMNRTLVRSSLFNQPPKYTHTDEDWRVNKN